MLLLILFVCHNFSIILPFSGLNGRGIRSSTLQGRLMMSEPGTKRDLNYTRMMQRLRTLIFAYERDPKHVITQEHILHRRACVISYGGDVVAEFIKSVYQELLEERSCHLSVTDVSSTSLHVPDAARKSTSAPARCAKRRKIFPTRRPVYLR